MIWHIVHLDFSEVDDAERERLEEQLAALAALDCVAFLRVGRDVEQPAVSGLVTVFASEDELASYRTHPDHVPVVEALRAAGVVTTRFDILSDDDVAALPA